MKKLAINDLKYLKQEFKKENVYILVTRPKEKSHKRFSIIENINNDGKIKIKSYDILHNYRMVYNDESRFCNWGWGYANFTLLNKKEAGKYLKTLIACQLN